jgi:hypothetical protein
MEAFGKFSFGTLLWVLSVLLEGFVFMKLWSWFISPTFGVDPINQVQSIGVMLVYSYIKTKSPDTEDFTFEVFLRKIVEAFFTGIMVLVIGYIVSLFM